MRASLNPVTEVVQAGLAQARTHMQVAYRERLDWVRYARSLGLSHQQIATPLGISEAAVRGLLERHPGS